MNTNQDYYCIMVFDNTTDVMQAESFLKQYFSIAVMPIPREISSGCGLSLRLLGNEELRLFEYLKTFSIHGTLYKKGNIKEKDGYPITKIFQFPCV